MLIRTTPVTQGLEPSFWWCVLETQRFASTSYRPASLSGTRLAQINSNQLGFWWILRVTKGTCNLENLEEKMTDFFWYHICKASVRHQEWKQKSCRVPIAVLLGQVTESTRKQHHLLLSGSQHVPTETTWHTHFRFALSIDYGKAHSKSSGVITRYHPVEELSRQTCKWRRVLHRINVVYSPYQVSKYAPWLASMHWVNTPRMKGIAWFWLSPFPSPKIG